MLVSHKKEAKLPVPDALTTWLHLLLAAGSRLLTAGQAKVDKEEEKEEGKEGKEKEEEGKEKLSYGGKDESKDTWEGLSSGGKDTREGLSSGGKDARKACRQRVLKAIKALLPKLGESGRRSRLDVALFTRFVDEVSD